MRLDGRVAVVTGGASGIGRAALEVLAEAGARVFAGDRDEPGASAACASLREAGRAAEAAFLDVTDPAAVESFANGVVREAGRVDVLVNAAGWDRFEPFLENPPGFWEDVVQINYLGPVRVCRAFLPTLIEAGAGAIVNVASDAGRVGSMGESVYAGAKGGVIAFTKSLAREVARDGVRVNCVSPGPTDTPLFRSLPERMQEALARAIPFRRVAEPREVADAILFFASDRARFVTGQVLSVSGGLTMAG